MVSIFSCAITGLTKLQSLSVSICSRSHRRKWFLWTAVAVFFCVPLMALDTKHDAQVDPGLTKKAAEAPIKYSSVHYQSGNRRDPFLNPLFLKKKTKVQDDEEVSRGLPPPGIAGTYIAQAALQGITIRDTGKVAVVRGADARAYFIRVSDRLFDGYVKDIQNDSITFVRETKLKSGKTLTQDVTKRLRTP